MFTNTTRRMTITSVVMTVTFLGSLIRNVDAFSVMPSSTQATGTLQATTSTSLHALPSPEQGGSFTDKDRRKPSSSLLSAVTVGSLSSTTPLLDANESFLKNAQQVLSASLLVTGSTVGASCLVLPETVAGPGMAVSSLLFVGAYLFNFLSGLAIAEVAIKQHEASGNQVPSSFKEFADVNLQSKEAANAISAISVFVNTCVVSFDLTRAGTVGAFLLGSSSSELSCFVSVVFAAIVTGLVSTMTSSKLSWIVSVAVMALFASFAGLLLPGMAHVSDPIGTLLAPGNDSTSAAAMAHSAPIILLAMVYQNIVPTVTKMLHYDRTKTTASLALGSFLPMIMYMAWCFTSLGGGIDASSFGGPLLTIFSIAAVTGSALGCTMSISQEVDILLKPAESTNQQQQGNKDEFSFSSVAISVAVPLVMGLGLAGGKDFAAALSAAGAYGDPLLYGAIPAVMAWTQRQKLASMPNLVPTASLGVLGAGSLAFLLQEAAKDFGNIVLGF